MNKIEKNDSMHDFSNFLKHQHPKKGFSVDKTKKRKEKKLSIFSLVQKMESDRKNPHSNKKSLDPAEENKTSFALLEKTLIQTSFEFEQQIQGVSSTQELNFLCTHLIEKLSYMEQKGVSTTTLLIGQSAKNSLLKNTEITLKCYDTAPCSFHIDFYSSPSGVEFLSKHLVSLTSELQKALPSTFFSISKPQLATFYGKKQKEINFKKIEKNKENKGY